MRSDETKEKIACACRALPVPQPEELHNTTPSLFAEATITSAPGQTWMTRTCKAHPPLFCHAVHLFNTRMTKTVAIKPTSCCTSGLASKKTMLKASRKGSQTCLWQGVWEGKMWRCACVYTHRTWHVTLASRLPVGGLNPRPKTIRLPEERWLSTLQIHKPQ